VKEKRLFKNEYSAEPGSPMPQAYWSRTSRTLANPVTKSKNCWRS